MADRPQPRFMSLADAAHVLGISSAQIYALVRRGEIPAMKIIDDHPYTAERSSEDQDEPVE